MRAGWNRRTTGFSRNPNHEWTLKEFPLHRPRLQIQSLGGVDGGFSVGENDGGVRSFLIVVAYE